MLIKQLIFYICGVMSDGWLDPSGPCRTESSDVGFDFIVVGTNKNLSFDELNSAEP